MNKLYLEIALGIGTTVVGVLSAYSFYSARKTQKELAEFNAAIEKMAGSIDVDIPEKIIQAAMDKAAEKSAENAAEATRAIAEKKVSNAVEAVISTTKNYMADDIKDELNRHINLVDISDIKSEVVKSASASIVKELAGKAIFGCSAANTSGIINACKDAGITSPWAIENIIKVSKGA